MLKDGSPRVGDIFERISDLNTLSALFMILEQITPTSFKCFIIDAPWTCTSDICVLITHVGKWEKICEMG